jgi:hypothetical protein
MAETLLRLRSRKPGAGGGRQIDAGGLSKVDEPDQLASNGVLLVVGQFKDYFDRFGQWFGHEEL